MINPCDLTGETVLVTGASAGIGRECAVLLSQLGAKVLLVSRRTEGLREALALLDGSQHSVHAFDLTDVDGIPSWMKGIAGEHGPLSGVVHCAGIQQTIPLRALTEQSMESVFRINVKSGLALARGFRQRGVYEQRSSIVYISSVMGVVGASGRSVYSASKGAITGMTRSLAMELVAQGIRVNCVVPGLVRTEMFDDLEKAMTQAQIAEISAMHPLGLGNPIDVAHAISFLLSPMSSWITGASLVVDGGYTAR